MRRYLRIYKRLLQLNLAILIEYRMNLINGLMSSIGWGLLSIFSMVLLTTRIKSVYSWSSEEILILTGCYSIFIGIFHTLFSRNFDRFSRVIEYAELDQLLLKPADPQFLLSFWLINYSGFARILIGIGFTFYFLKKAGLVISLLNILHFLMLLIVGVVVLYSIWYIVSTVMIWFPRLSNLIDLLFNFTNVTRYPQEIIREANYFLFLFLLPMTLIVTIPTKALIGKVLGGDVWLLLVFSIGLFWLSRIFWRFALRFYTSAN